MAASKPGETDELCRRFQDFDYIRFSFSDLNGVSRNKIIPARNASGFVKSGTGYFGGVIAGGPRTEETDLPRVTAKNFPNAMVVPDPTTFHPVPWASTDKYKVGEVICETHWQDMTYQEAGPRHVARRQLERLKEHGLSIMSAFEMELTLYDSKTGDPIFDGTDYAATLVQGELEPFFFHIDDNLRQAGVDLEAMHAEHAPGQIETVMKPAFGINAADQAFQLKHAVKEMAQKRGMDANFMAKPNPEAAGNGTHFNFSIWDINTGANAMSDLSKPDKLSELASYWIAGMVEHIGALSLLCAPTVNCYRRFHKPWAPSLADWNIDDRTVSFRVKNYSPKSTYIENRIPSGLCNPYLVLAVTLAAGLDGIERKLECPPKGSYDNVPRIPDTLQEAVCALEADSVICKALGDEFVEWFIAIKKQIDMEKLKDSDVKVNDAKALAAEFEEYSKFM